MPRGTPDANRTDTPFPYTTLFRSRPPRTAPARRSHARAAPRRSQRPRKRAWSVRTRTSGEEVAANTVPTGQFTQAVRALISTPCGDMIWGEEDDETADDPAGGFAARSMPSTTVAHADRRADAGHARCAQRTVHERHSVAEGRSGSS